MTDQLELANPTRSEATKRAWETRRKNTAPQPQPAGAISEEQAQTMQRMFRAVIHARDEYSAASEKLENCQQALDDFIESLTAKVTP